MEEVIEEAEPQETLFEDAPVEVEEPPVEEVEVTQEPERRGGGGRRGGFLGRFRGRQNKGPEKPAPKKPQQPSPATSAPSRRSGGISSFFNRRRRPGKEPQQAAPEEAAPAEEFPTPLEQEADLGVEETLLEELEEPAPTAYEPVEEEVVEEAPQKKNKMRNRFFLNRRRNRS